MPTLGFLAADPGRACLLTDFDGTLAPIVADPDAARPLVGAVEVLSHLARRLGTVAVVSGRPAGWLHALIGDTVTLSGLYGLELVRAGSDGVVEVSEDAERWRSVIDEVGKEAEGRAPEGVLVEHKGLALTLHVRRAIGEVPWVAGFCAEAAARTGLVVHAAKMSLELRPAVAADKGTVVLGLALGSTTVAYLGDDVGDLPAFAALDHLATEGVETLKVAVGGPELDPMVSRSADVVVDGPEACLALLVDLHTTLG